MVSEPNLRCRSTPVGRPGGSKLLTSVEELVAVWEQWNGLSTAAGPPRLLWVKSLEIARHARRNPSGREFGEFKRSQTLIHDWMAGDEKGWNHRVPNQTCNGVAPFLLSSSWLVAGGSVEGGGVVQSAP
jgi:hypothetical protein